MVGTPPYPCTHILLHTITTGSPHPGEGGAPALRRQLRWQGERQRSLGRVCLWDWGGEGRREEHATSIPQPTTPDGGLAPATHPHTHTHPSTHPSLPSHTTHTRTDIPPPRFPSRTHPTTPTLGLQRPVAHHGVLQLPALPQRGVHRLRRLQGRAGLLQQGRLRARARVCLFGCLFWW